MRFLVGVVVSLVAASSPAQVLNTAETLQVQAKLPSVRGCWERVVREEPTPTKATLAIEVDLQGTVTRVTMEPLPARLVSCVEARVRTWKFPSGPPRQLSYPIVLVSAAE